MANPFTQLIQPLATGFSVPSTTTTGTTVPAPVTTTAPVGVLAPATVSPINTTQAIPASSLGKAVPTIPTPAPATSASNTLASSLAGFQAQLQGLQKQLTTPATTEAPTATPKNTLQTGIQDFLGLSKQFADKGTDTAKAREDNKIAEKAQKVTDLTNEFNARSKYYDDQIRKLDAKNTQGLGAEVIEAKKQELSRQKNQELADIAISQAAATGNLQVAQDLAKQAVDDKYEPIKQQLELQKQYLDLARNDMSASEVKAADQAYQTKKDAVDFEQQKDLIAYKQKIEQSSPMFQLELQAKRQAIAQGGLAAGGTAAAIAAADPDTQKLLGLLQQYRSAIDNSNLLERIGGPKTRQKLDSLKGQITAVYKTQQKLGTLDSGVQKLIDSIVPSGNAFSPATFSKQAQLDAIDNFMTNTSGATDPLGIL